MTVDIKASVGRPDHASGPDKAEDDTRWSPSLPFSSTITVIVVPSQFWCSLVAATSGTGIPGRDQTCSSLKIKVIESG